MLSLFSHMSKAVQLWIRCPVLLLGNKLYDNHLSLGLIVTIIPTPNHCCWFVFYLPHVSPLWYSQMDYKMGYKISEFLGSRMQPLKRHKAGNFRARFTRPSVVLPTFSLPQCLILVCHSTLKDETGLKTTTPAENSGMEFLMENTRPRDKCSITERNNK